MGDGFGSSEQEQLYIAGNSEGYIEKYTESDKSWNEIDIRLLLIEGSRFVPIKPSVVYSIYVHLSKSIDENETGKYRIRIDYYDFENPDSSVVPFQDYSNTFEIQWYKDILEDI